MAVRDGSVYIQGRDLSANCVYNQNLTTTNYIPSVRWRIGGQGVSNSGSRTITTALQDYGLNSTLNIRGVRASDNGKKGGQSIEVIH